MCIVMSCELSVVLSMLLSDGEVSSPLILLVTLFSAANVTAVSDVALVVSN